MDMSQVLTVFGVVATNLITVITLYMHLDNSTSKKIEENRRESNNILLSIQQEMKDFHTRLALQDQEFKMRLCAIEEKNKVRQ